MLSTKPVTRLSFLGNVMSHVPRSIAPRLVAVTCDADPHDRASNFKLYLSWDWDPFVEAQPALLLEPCPDTYLKTQFGFPGEDDYRELAISDRSGAWRHYPRLNAYMWLPRCDPAREVIIRPWEIHDPSIVLDVLPNNSLWLRSVELK